VVQPAFHKPVGSEKSAPVVLDLNLTEDPLYGQQEGRFFNGYYDSYCYLPLPELIFYLLLAAAFAGFWFAVFRKAGYGVWQSLVFAFGMLVPPITMIVALYSMFAVWPVEAELASLRSKAGLGSVEDAWDAFCAASRLESRGDVKGALAGYRAVIEQHPGTEAAKDAKLSLERLSLGGHQSHFAASILPSYVAD
jgi:hypothetical protein